MGSYNNKYSKKKWLPDFILDLSIKRWEKAKKKEKKKTVAVNEVPCSIS